MFCLLRRCRRRDVHVPPTLGRSQPDTTLEDAEPVPTVLRVLDSAQRDRVVSGVRVPGPSAASPLQLAMCVRPLADAAGTEVIREGEGGKVFYLIGSGQVDVIHGGKLVATLGTGQYFGEIALLHDVPRVATCVARSDAELYELKRQVFVSAVSGNVQSHGTIEDVVAGRLDELESIRATEAKKLQL